MLQHVLKLPELSTHASFESRTSLVSGCVSEALLNGAVQNVQFS